MRKHGVFEVVDERECYDNGGNPLTLKWVDKMTGDVPFEVGLSGDQASQEQRRTAWTRRRILTHASVGRVQDAGVHDDDGTRRRNSHGWTD